MEFVDIKFGVCPIFEMILIEHPFIEGTNEELLGRFRG
jgi:hypothetical protein